METLSIQLRQNEIKALQTWESSVASSVSVGKLAGKPLSCLLSTAPSLCISAADMMCCRGGVSAAKLLELLARTFSLLSDWLICSGGLAEVGKLDPDFISFRLDALSCKFDALS